MATLTVFFPTKDSAGTAIPKPRWRHDLREVQTVLATTFGGFTATKAFGGWKNPETGAIVVERVIRFEVFTDSDTIEKTAPDFRAWIKKLGRHLGQGAMAYQIDGTFEEIPCQN